MFEYGRVRSSGIFEDSCALTAERLSFNTGFRVEWNDGSNKAAAQMQKMPDLNIRRDQAPYVRLKAPTLKHSEAPPTAVTWQKEINFFKMYPWKNGDQITFTAQKHRGKRSVLKWHS